MERSVIHYTKRVSDILRKNGAVSLFKKGCLHIFGDRRFTIYNSHKNYIVNQLRWEIPARPFDHILIDPNEIEYRTSSGFHVHDGFGQIRNGEWDRQSNLSCLSNQLYYTGIKQRFEQGYDWGDTDYYIYIDDRINNEGSLWGYQSTDNLVSGRCAYIDSLYNSVKKSGYKSQREVDCEFPESDNRSGNYQDQLEVIICIGRGGELYLMDGVHRLTIAQILNVDSIPVLVLCRHRKWQRLRDDIYTDNNPQKNSGKFYNHPDSLDVIS